MSTATATPFATFYVHDSNVVALVSAVGDVAAKLADKLPGIAVHTVLGEPRRSAWCGAHRTWVEPGKAVCPFLAGNTSDQVSPCHIGPATQVAVEIHVDGLPVWNGWGVGGVLTRNRDGVILATTVGGLDEGFAMSLAHLMGECVHCGLTRNRTTTVLLTHDETGEVRPVGKTCLADYTGAVIRFEALAALTTLRERFAQAAGGVLSAEPVSAPTVDVVALAMRYIATTGSYVRSGEYGGGRTPTADEVRAALLDTGQGPRPLATAADLTEVDRAAAREAIALVLSEQSGSEYVLNLQSAAAAEWAQVLGKGNTVGLLASLPVAASRISERVARETTTSDRVDTWIGRTGERREFTGRVVSARTVEGDWGVSELLVIDTNEGTVKVLGRINFPTAVDRIEELVGKGIRLTGTIARHEEYRGAKQTKINRVKVAEIL